MGFYKSKWLNEYNLNKPKFYLRYVDDILAAFDNEQNLLNFLDFLNKRHPNIKFTIEKQINHSIAFLGAFISGINDQNHFKYITNWPIQPLIFKYLHSTAICLNSYNSLSFKIIDKANSNST